MPQLSDGRTFVTTKVKSLEKTSKKKFVYDLTVDEAHDFFANGILVLNCMDATRYALNILLSSGTSYITETSTEEPVMIAEEKPKRKCRRVFSTSD